MFPPPLLFLSFLFAFFFAYPPRFLFQYRKRSRYPFGLFRPAARKGQASQGFGRIENVEGRIELIGDV
jgi:hypothetical protein